MTVYYILIAAILLLGLFTKKLPQKYSDKIFMLTAFLIIILLGGLRKYTVGYDLSDQYAATYTLMGRMSWGSALGLRYEPGYVILCKLMYMISPDPQFYIVITSVIIYGSIGIFIYRNSEDVRISTYAFIMFNMFMNDMNIIRQCIAVAIILFGTERLKRKQYIRFALFVLVAMSFHTSAILALSMIVFDIIRYKRKYVFITLGIFAAFIVLGRQFFSFATSLLNQYEGYSSKGNSGVAVINAYTIFNSLLALILFLLANRYIFLEAKTVRYSLNKQRRKVYLMVGSKKLALSGKQEQTSFSNEFLMYMGFMLLLTQSSSLSMLILSRMRIIFQPFMLLLIPKILNRIEYRLLVRYILIAFLVVYFVYTGNTTSYSNYGTIPYLFFWQ